MAAVDGGCYGACCAQAVPQASSDNDNDKNERLKRRERENDGYAMFIS